MTTMTPLGHKIMLDRYALKDTKRETIKAGDTVLVIVDKNTGQREVGQVLDTFTYQGSPYAIVIYDDDLDTVANYRFEDLDKPLETSYDQIVDRVSRAVAANELNPSFWENEFRMIMKDFKFIPAGRILAAAGAPGALTFFNCYVLPSPHDSREGIFMRLSEMAEIMSRGGGVGMNISSLRPKKAYVKGVNGRSSGAVSWGSLYSTVTGLIEQGGSRRGALMLIMNDWHPDILEFVNSKREAGKITNANISVALSDRFMQAVKDDADWDLVFPDTTHHAYDLVWTGNLQEANDAGIPIVTYKTIKARELWDAIISSAHASAEPGIWFNDRSELFSNSFYYDQLTATNPCGEQPLPAWSVCNLGAINLAEFYDEGTGSVKWGSLGKTIKTAVRFLDNVIDTTPYFYEENEIQQKKERRIGLNTMGLAELLIKCHIRYGSEESLKFIDGLYEFIASNAYMASTDLAVLREPFPAFEASKFMESEYVKGLPTSVKQLIRKNGIRNVTLLTQAPNGTIGTMVGTSTGIEPFFSFEWTRKSRLGTHKEDIAIARNAPRPLPGYFVTAMDLTPEEHVRVQAVIQRWVDSAISKTVNMPTSATKEDVAEVYTLMHTLGCKGGTVYRDKSRDDQILRPSNNITVTSKAFDVKTILLTKETYSQEFPKPEDVCPECHEKTLLHESGCETCTSCGYSLCTL